MILTTIGPRGFHQATAVASLTFTPLFDRAAIVKRIWVTTPSASDNWIVSIQGQECARYPINTTGNQQMLGGPSSAIPKVTDIFSFCKYYLGFDLIYPVPQGQTLTVSSAGGATATIYIEFEERSPGDVQPGMLNGQMSNRFVMPVFLVPSATISSTVAAESQFASQIAANWLPNLFGLVQIPAAYTIKILAFFLEGAGINTFSGAANHQGQTDHLGIIYQGQRMFTRDALGGIPNVGTASAGGSANTVIGANIAAYPAFQLIDEDFWQPLPYPLVLEPGSQMNFLFGVTGDATGNANYSTILQGFLADVQFTGMVPQ